MPTLQDRIVWITGAGSGIGRAIAIGFAAAGARVALTGRRVVGRHCLRYDNRADGQPSLAILCARDRKSHPITFHLRMVPKETIFWNLGYGVSPGAGSILKMVSPGFMRSSLSRANSSI